MGDTNGMPPDRSLFSDLPAVRVLGVTIHTLSVEQLLSLVSQAIIRQERMMIAYANVHGLNLACERPWFRAFLNRSEVVFCDGFGVKWGARLLGQSIPQRFTPPDWLDRLASMAGRHGFRLFLLGARPGVADKAAARLQARSPGVQIVGTQHGYFDKTAGSIENEAVLQAINAAQPHILIVGFGMPIQERWLLENWRHIEAPVALPVGAAFDYIAGETQRGPGWMTDHGLEWLSRLVIEPRRLWRRYLIGNPLFLWRVLLQRMGWLRLD